MKNGTISGTSHRRRAGGFSLIEALVSMVVLSLGGLSMASLQILSTRNVHDGGQRLTAAHLANAFLERLRANHSSEALRGYVAGAVALGRGSAGAIPARDCLDRGAACTPAELARFDMWLWEQLLDGATEQVQTGGRAENAGGLMYPTACLLAPAAGAGRSGNYTLAIAYRGAVAMESNATVACGLGAMAADGAPLYGDHDEFRRIVLVQAYIMPQAAR